ncbi:hypothetical protein M569_16650, partial [Genlisea aurea]
AMGKSTQSCFKILACGSKSVDREDLQATELQCKSPSDRRGWSFRKRSARHRVLSNNVSSELSVNIETSESKTAIGAESGLSGKTPVIQPAEEKPVTPNQTETSPSDVVVTTDAIHNADGILDETSIIIIQAAIRGLLAQKEILKARNIIKLQAAIRGHLVRRHAVGALRCVRAVIKIQKLVRARRARFFIDDSGDSVRPIE